MIAGIDGRGADAGHVGSGPGLGHTDGGDELTAHETREPALLLFGGGQLGEIWQADVVVDGETQAHRTAVSVHEGFDQDLVVAKIGGADTAELFVGGEAEQPDRTGLHEQLAGNDAVVIPPVDVRCDLLGREITRQIGECAVIAVVVHALHRRSVGMGARWGGRVPLSRHDRPQRSQMLRYSVVVTTADTEVMPDAASVNPDELRDKLRQADPGVLVAVLAQLTGDPSVIDRFGPKISHVPDRTAPACPETFWFESSAAGWALVLSVVGGFQLDWWDVAAVLVEAAVVEPVDPFGGGELDVLDGPPGLAGLDQLGLVEPVDGLGQGVVVGAADRPDRGRMPASASRSVYRIEVYWIPRSVWCDKTVQVEDSLTLAGSRSPARWRRATMLVVIVGRPASPGSAGRRRR